MCCSIRSAEQLDVLAAKGFTCNGISPSAKYLGCRSPVPSSIPLTRLYEILDRCVAQGRAYTSGCLCGEVVANKAMGA